MIQSGMLVTLLDGPITSPFTKERSNFIIVQFERTPLIRGVMHSVRYADLRRELAPHADSRILRISPSYIYLMTSAKVIFLGFNLSVKLEFSALILIG